MRKLAAIVFFLTVAGFTSSSLAGVVGWLTATDCDWGSVQKTGGIRIGSPERKGGSWVLPVTYDVTGLSKVTRRPTRINSGAVVREVKATRKGHDIVLLVVSQVAEKGGKTGKEHLAKLPGIGPGRYEVYYQTAGDSDKRLGAIEIK